ncbi:hypothetical protein Q5P01_013588 [Channa striata]|uniref:RAP domain-containing protein n=1 Tax=Channa striata TaxID=64152 RepID=A0AA88SJ97_CHASR|nr:hypothetical protein Q5P01_013588 [Channa striata]
MAACMLCRRVPRLRHLQGLIKDFTQAQPDYGKPEDDTDEQEGRKGAVQHQNTTVQGGYRLYYSPASYGHSARNSQASRTKIENHEDEHFSTTLTPSFWQQSNRYSVSCSRHLSSSKNTLLDLAFNTKSEPEMPKMSVYHRTPISPNVKVNSRAFIKCRPEYVSVTLDLTQRPHPIEWDEAWPLLQKVSILKGSIKPSDVPQFLLELSRLHPDKMSLVRSDHCFIMLLRYSVEHLQHFTDLQLLKVLESFVWLDIPPAHTVLELYEAELCRRAKHMSLHQLFLAADMWRCIGRQVPQFLQCLYDSVHLCLDKIGVPELVQLLYIMGEGRQCPKDLIHPVEQLLMCHLKQLYPEEVGTVCLGLFKSQTSLPVTVVNRIVDKACSFVKEMSDFAIVNVMKFLRFSYLYHTEWLEAMGREVPQRAHRMGVQGLMHVVLTCSALHYRNENLLIAVADRVPSMVPHCRTKDSCKLLWAFGTLGFPPVQNSSFYPSLVEALRQKKVEFLRYPEHLLTALLGLAFVAQFPEDLIALALSPDFVNSILKSTQLELKKDLLTIDGAVDLEFPQWTGPRLSRELREEVADMLWKFAQSDVCQKPEVQEAEAALQNLLGGEEFVRKTMILPHTRSIDLEVHLDPTGKAIPVNPAPHKAALAPENGSSKLTSNQGWGRINIGVTITEDLLAQLTNTRNPTQPSTPPSTIKPTSLYRVEPEESERLFSTGLNLTTDIIESLTKPSAQNSNGIVKLAIQVTNRNHYCSHSQQLLGLHAMKRRHLTMAGYRVVELKHHEWFPMIRKSMVEKLAYLHCKIYNSL